MVTNPSLILLDEPFSGVDPIAVEELQKEIRQLVDSGVSILITDHNVERTLENIKIREESELKRYKDLYGVSYMDESQYDFVLDTSDINIEQVTEKVLEAIEKAKHVEKK